MSLLALVDLGCCVLSQRSSKGVKGSVDGVDVGGVELASVDRGAVRELIGEVVGPDDDLPKRGEADTAARGGQERLDEHEVVGDPPVGADLA